MNDVNQLLKKIFIVAVISSITVASLNACSNRSEKWKGYRSTSTYHMFCEIFGDRKVELGRYGSDFWFEENRIAYRNPDGQIVYYYNIQNCLIAPNERPTV